MKNQTKLALAAAVMSTMMAGCMTTGGYDQGGYGSQDPYGQAPDPSNDRTKKGALIGAAVGAVAGARQRGAGADRASDGAGDSVARG